MKLRFLSLVAAAGIFFSSCGTTYQSTSDNAAYNVNVPSNIRSNFAISYPDATTVVWNSYDVSSVPIDWELSGWNAVGTDAYTVSFNMGNDQYYAWYDANGNLIGTTTMVSDYSRMPYAISTTLNSKYNGYTIDKINKEISGTTTNYEIKLSQGDHEMKVLADSNGNVLKEKMD